MDHHHVAKRRLGRLFLVYFIFSSTCTIILFHLLALPVMPFKQMPALLGKRTASEQALAGNRTSLAATGGGRELPSRSPAQASASEGDDIFPVGPLAGGAIDHVDDMVPNRQALSSGNVKVNMTWEAVYGKSPDPERLPELDGVNVVSPTWFELANGAGDISSKADLDYVRWAKERSLQIWAMFSNGFEPIRTSKALSTKKSREHMIKQLLQYAESYDLQGINFDFENVKTEDGKNFVQFIKEAAPLLHERNLVVSVDVTPKSDSEYWSLFLDRPALVPYVDFMMLMAYDEHWASSPKSGSVSSLPWVRRSVEGLLDEDGIPPSKIVLSMPLYTRIWTETPKSSGGSKVTSKALGMKKAAELVAARKLTPAYDRKTGQNYVEYREDGQLKRIWLEDSTSIKARVAIAKEYGLAGVATWSRSFMDSGIWNVIKKELE
ncbi:glycosyl hydrolase family 18 protein [Paenibacillus sp. D9]|uniref:glycosyl hydrolase family 18 protein n=1 Tax=Paenibacillus sp. D9 TaxID=665792 RepID=UPI0006768979|nr:glycosyl hydrolase family 18 protein [Paenibacillus sp. D9]